MTRKILRKNFIFDLDDTLFKENEWVKSALQHCADILAEMFSLDAAKVLAIFLKGLSERGRGQVFYQSLVQLGVAEPEEVKQYLIYRYRTHKPLISLAPEVKSTLEQLKAHNCRLGIITDGALSAQMNKVEALGLNEIMDAVVYTEVLGPESRKPSPLPYQLMKRWLGSEGEFWYVGDNPEKDFHGAHLAEYRTVMLKNPNNTLKLTNLPISCLAEKQIDKFEELLRFV